MSDIDFLFLVLLICVVLWIVFKLGEYSGRDKELESQRLQKQIDEETDPEIRKKLLLKWNDLSGDSSFVKKIFKEALLSEKNSKNKKNDSKIDLEFEVNRLFDDFSIPESDEPKAIILIGPVAVGKTTLRMNEYSKGYVLIDAAEIFHHLSHGDASLDFPDAFQEQLEHIGRLAASRAIKERRNIVTEIIGDNFESTKKLIDLLTSIGYKVETIAVTCDMEEAWQRNLNRGDNISAYYAEPFQYKWIIDACKEQKKNANLGS